MVKGLRALLVLAAVSAGLVLGAGYAGGLHPAGDSLSVVRGQSALVTVLAAGGLALSGAGWALWLAGLGAVALAQSAWVWLAPAGELHQTADLTVYQKNLSFRLADPGALIADIKAADPDVLTLQEVTTTTSAVLNALSEELPTQVVCIFASAGSVGLATRLQALSDPVCAERKGLVAVKVAGPSGPLWLVSLHQHWPWPYSQDGQERALLPFLRGLDAPAVIGGDFNMMPWGSSIRRVAEATGTERAGRAWNTFPAFGPIFPLAIDHVLVPKGAVARTEPRERLGSDHLGLLARLDLP